VIRRLGKRTCLFFIEIDGQGSPGFLDWTVAINLSAIAGEGPGQVKSLKRHFADKRKVLPGFGHLLKDWVVQSKPLMQRLFQFVPEFLFAQHFLSP
jgi:hypothetical protein